MADQRFSLSKLNNDNYQSWKFKMEMLLIREETWYVIDKDKPGVVPTSWTKNDAKARATIGLCVEDSQASLIRSCKSAKEAWEALQKYHDKGSEVYLLKKLTRLELSDGGNMEQHLQEFTDLLQRIADTGEEIPKKWQVAMLLCSLPESYDPLTTALEQRPAKELDLNLVKSKLLAEAEKRRERSGGADGTDSEKALVTKARGGTRKNNEDPPLCHYCQKPGHFKRNCRLRKKNESASSEKKEEESGEEDNEKTMLCFLVGHGEPTVWFIDSGASGHMTGDRGFFSALKEFSDAGVVLADGTKAEVAGIGNGRIVGLNENGDAVEILLEDVLLVPKLKSGLISVSTLTSNGFCVVFEGDRCEIRNKCKEMLASATKFGSLYKLCTQDHALACVQQSHTVDRPQPWLVHTVGYSEQDEEYRLLDKTMIASS